VRECVSHVGYLVCVCVSLARVLRSAPDGKEVDDPGGEVQSHVYFTVDHRDAVSVPVAGPGHAAAEQQKRRPNTHTHIYRFKFSPSLLRD